MIKLMIHVVLSRIKMPEKNHIIKSHKEIVFIKNFILSFLRICRFS